MSGNRRVVWSEGLFLRPHHFQQQERALERALDIRAGGGRSHAWGFAELELEPDLLMVGKLALKRARGVFPDGTAFAMPDDEPLPPPFEVPPTLRNQVVYLALPAKRAGVAETERTPAADSLARYAAEAATVRDAVAGYDGEAVLEVGALRARLVPASMPSEGYVRIPVARVVERRSDGRVLLDDRFVPTTLAARAAPRLQSFLVELQGLLRQRGGLLAGRAVATGRGASAEIADFLMLQTVNRYEPVFTHWAQAAQVHPEDAWLRLVELAGDLATLTSATRRPEAFPPYVHEDLQATYEPVIAALRAAFNVVMEQAATPIPLVFKRAAHVGVVPDPALFDTSSFVLAVRADVAPESMRVAVPAQVKIAEKDRLSTIVNRVLPGIPLQPMAVAPRQIPYVNGSAYFELLQGGEEWRELRKSGQVAIWVYDRERAFPNLALELWAVRSG